MKYLYSLITLLLITPSLLVAQTQFNPSYTGVFGGFTADGNNYTFPSGAEGWAGVSNENADIYPLSFSDAGSITFTASTAAADGSTNIKFRFEKNPHPDVEPSYNTEEVTVNGTSSNYSITIPSQGANTFRSALLYVVDRDETVTITNIVITADTPPEPIVGTTVLNFEAESQVTSWIKTGNTSILEHVTSGGNPDGAMRFGSPDDQGATFTYSDASFNYENAASAKLFFDIKQSSATLAGCAIHIRHSNPGGAENPKFTGAIQTGINTNTWVTKEYDIELDGSTTTGELYIQFETALGAGATHEGVFLLDNVAVALLDENGATLSTYEIETPQFITYPNPLQNTLNVKGTMEVENVSIYDLMGRNVLNAAPNKTEFSLDVSHLNKGVYMVQLKAGDKETTLKVIK